MGERPLPRLPWPGLPLFLTRSSAVRRGNLNPLIYRLANQAYSTAFHDVTVASSGVTNCTTLPSLCNNSVAGVSTTTLMTGTAGYQLTTGYDLASGWGSLDVANFVTAALATGASTTTKLAGSSGTLTGTQTLTFTAVVSPATSAATAPTGTVQFFANGVTLGSAVSLNSSGQGTYSVASTSLSFGPEQITAVYNGDSSFEASTSNALSLVLNPTGTANRHTHSFCDPGDPDGGPGSGAHGAVRQQRLHDSAHREHHAVYR